MKRYLLLVIIAAAACLILVTIGWTAWTLPLRAEAVFGPPADSLSLFQRVTLSARLLAREQSLLTPKDPAAEPQPFHIELGESTFDILQRLESEGLIRDTDLLRLYIIYSGLDKTLQAGDYTLSPSLSPIEIARSLQDATPTEVSFRILPGWRLEEIADALPTSGLSFTPEAFLIYSAHPPEGLPIISELLAGTSLEGFLLPDSYRVKRDSTIHAFVLQTLQNFELKVDHDLRLGFETQGLDLYQAVTLASMVEREAVLEDEMPMIASVFLNRLATGMRLDSDPTVQYAIGFDSEGQTWWKNPLSLDDLQQDSPYNTYRTMGLPPGPIASPGLSALQAVAYPAQTPYYYFRAACDDSGRHVFAETYEQHQANACTPITP